MTVCAALNIDKKICQRIAIINYRGKMLCLMHSDKLKSGNLLDWAPKRLIEWEMNRRMAEAIHRKYIHDLSMEVHNGVQR